VSEPGQQHEKLRRNVEAEQGLRDEVQKLRTTSKEAQDLLRRKAVEDEYRLRRRG
jgi:hypothetical protein